MTDISLKDSVDTVDENVRCTPPHTLRIYAMNARLEANRRHQERQFYNDLADRYDRMAAARIGLWAEYSRQCLELEE